MKYLLKNKDKVVLEFEVTTDTEEYQGISRQYTSLANLKSVNNKLLPYSMEASLSSLEKWIKNRKIPKNRAFVNDVLKTLNVDSEDNIMAYVDISLALSLNDSYWIIPADKDYKWSDYNLYENEFDKALALVAFSGGSYKASKITSSPEYTTNGMLPKCWHRNDGQIYLYKGSSEKYANGGKESYAEYYMAQVAKALGFEHTPYDLREFHGQVVSSCPLFTNENEGYVNIYACLDKDIRKTYKLRLIEPIQKIYGEERFADLMVFDALICNVDRHLGNFGMIIDNNTNEILRPAPIFDNGFSMINILTQDELKDIPTAIANMQHSFFDFSFNEQLKLFIQPRHIKNLEKFKSFEFTKHKEFNLPDAWLESIQKAIQERAELAIDFCVKTQATRKKLNAMPKPHTDKTKKPRADKSHTSAHSEIFSVSVRDTQTKSKIRKQR